MYILSLYKINSLNMFIYIYKYISTKGFHTLHCILSPIFTFAQKNYFKSVLECKWHICGFHETY